MKNSRSKKVFLLILILMVLFIVIYLAQRKTPIDKRINLFSRPLEEIQYISMSNIEDSLHFEKDLETNEWRITFPYTRKISSQKLIDLFTNVLTIQRFNKILTDDPNKLSQYRVTSETGNRLVIYDKNHEVIDDYYFGIADLLTYGAARRTSELAVYELTANVFNQISPKFFLWRENEIIKINISAIDSIQVFQKNNNYTLINQQTRWFYKNSTESFPLDNLHRSFARILSLLQNMKTYNFLDEAYDEYSHLFDEPLLEIKFYTNNKTDTLLFTYLNDRSCLIKVNDETDTLYLGSYDMVNRFRISTAEFQEVFKYSL